MRIPLIKVFDHPWVKAFQNKYNLGKRILENRLSDNAKKEIKDEYGNIVSAQGVSNE